MGFNTKICDHLKSFNLRNIKKDDTYECAICVQNGDSWVHLRTCQECGITLCCDSSPNKHASKHFKKHEHPVIVSAEPNENWAWCYEHKSFIQF
ncbi:UBP-type zinc finger domain-containing protein [Aquimarina sp. Aq107]|uniref:UBP-type zinc finger domain-containing protein n=1 Tax=Aquimarina sp. Aq107 TaxID=1191912 RepID=UPI000D560A26|nr:UBP-type zinc finger domain-containing protein [Aquimarina sp. Aq107]